MKYALWSIVLTGLPAAAFAQNSSHSKTAAAVPERQHRVNVNHRHAPYFPLKRLSSPISGMNGHLFPAGSIVSGPKEKGGNNPRVYTVPTFIQRPHRIT